MNNIPDIIPTMDKCQLPYSFASGSNVSKDMYIMIPATAAIATPIIICGIKKCNSIIPIIAPIGSLIPDRAAYNVAYRFFPVEWYIGSATAIPSGILCIAIAIATEIPSVKS